VIIGILFVESVIQFLSTMYIGCINNESFSMKFNILLFVDVKLHQIAFRCHQTLISMFFGRNRWGIDLNKSEEA